jgi:XTP/dITP diphosphohydrolase
MRILAATTNRGKIGEITRILSVPNITVLSPVDLNLFLDVPEDGTTFAENAATKALAWHRAGGLPSLADDSGLCVDALDGRPGVHSARFAGAGAGDRENCELLLRLMEGIRRRSAHFVCVVALAVSEETVITATGQCEGVILTEPRERNGFGYDPVFLDPGSGRTFAELSAEEKNALSHRRKALEELKGKLEVQGII